MENNRIFKWRDACKYIKVEVNNAILNKTRIELDAMWDGYYGLETNNDDLSPEAILERYKDLWRIELLGFLKVI